MDVDSGQLQIVDEPLTPRPPAPPRITIIRKRKLADPNVISTTNTVPYSIDGGSDPKKQRTEPTKVSHAQSVVLVPEDALLIRNSKLLVSSATPNADIRDSYPGKPSVLKTILCEPTVVTLESYVYMCVEIMSRLKQLDPRIKINYQLMELITLVSKLKNITYLKYMLLLMVVWLEPFRDYVTINEDPRKWRIFYPILCRRMENYIYGKRTCADGKNSKFSMNQLHENNCGWITNDLTSIYGML